MKIKGNELSFKTFSWMKVNDCEIQVPKIGKDLIPMESSEKYVRHLKEFDNLKFGISQEALDLVKEDMNLYRIYETIKGEDIVYNPCYFKTDDDNPNLVDVQDIIAHEGSKIKVFLDYYSEGKKEKFRNTLIRILAEKDTEVSLFVIQREGSEAKSLESIGIFAHENAKVNLCQYQLGCGKLYTNYKCLLDGKKSEAHVNSVYFGQGEEELNLFYEMTHKGEKTTSSILVNGALKDKAYKNFKSNLDFLEGCNDAVGSEGEFAVLLSDDVHTISVPLMLCHEDDVEGNHASSSGKIDPQILFYIMSRGFSYDEAEALIIESKFSQAIDLLDNEELEEEVWQSVRKILVK